MSYWVEYEKNGKKYWKIVGFTAEEIKYCVTIVLACFVMAVVVSVL